VVTSRSERAPSAGSMERRTTRQLLTAGVSLALIVLAVLSVTGVLVFSRSTSIGNELIDRETPALVDSVRLEGALVDQETGVRGYGLTGQRDFLDPYETGLSEQRQALSRLDTLLRGNAVEAADLHHALDAIGVWQRRIARPVAASPAGAPVALASQRADEGKADFDAVRSALAVQQKHLQSDRDHTRTQLAHVDIERNAVLLLIAAVVLALTVLVFTGLRRGVTGPLEQLSQDVRTVARGDFHHEVGRTGPADLRRLASDVDAMRRRLAEELAFTNEARELLDEQASDLRRSNAELEQFAYVASHDLQEPLRKVASFCQLLERRYSEQLDERAVQYIAFAVDGANRMQGLINDLLAFSRVGRLNTEHTPVDLEALFTRTQDSLSIAVEEAGAQITHDPLPTVPGDSTQLGMVLQNLLSNAVKFRAPDRPIAIHVGVERQDGLWRLSVADNGIGIDQAYAEKVFVIFQRLHTRDTYPGNGIGLALCKKIVEYHGGTIHIDAEHSPGARISFTLPATPDPEHKSADLSYVGVSEGGSSHGSRLESVSERFAALDAARSAAAADRAEDPAGGQP
jgi:signal transduction histidine kinase